jgi:hypothetical protein
MKKGLFIPVITLVIIFSLLLSACQTGSSGGIPQAQYDQVSAQLADAQSKLAQAQNDLAKAQADKAAVDNDLINAKATVKDLQNQVNALKDQTTLTGATPAETAEKIVKYYHETHVYSTYDYFICGDMASEVWNMLKAQNISAVIVVGDAHNLISDILDSNHAWVLATVAPGEVLALETTAGRVVRKSENPYYYVGWTFNSPADLKANNDMRKEYNTRVAVRNNIAAEDRSVIEQYNKSPSDKLEAVHNELVKLIQAQETELNNIKAKIAQLATQLY